ncbi:Carboxypeptidase regulatory-like domain-containing protein [Micrococcales bacterium KH10]|nr:Carboxypeptidase regulatory-like domain-containing protein [Micrococcales bacterium KH10]
MNTSRLTLRTPSGLSAVSSRHGISLVIAFVVAVAVAMSGLATAPGAFAASSASVTIKVTTRSGTAAPGLYVAIGDKIKKTRLDGTAKFKGLKPGTRGVVISETKGYITTGWKYDTKLRLSAGKNSAKTIRAARLSVIRGKVTRNGKAVKNVPVTVTMTVSGRSRAATTAKDGSYAISMGKRARKGDDARISVTTKHGTITYAPGALRQSEAKVQKLSWTRSHTVNIRLREGPKGWVEGRVKQADGKPAGGATVSLYEGSWDPHAPYVDDRRVRTTTADANGKYTIGGVAPGSYQVVAADSGARGVGQSAPQRVAVKAKKVKAPAVTFRKTGTVRVPFIVAPNSGDVSVGLLDERGRLVEARSVYLHSEQTEGSATFSYVPEGTYRATIVGTGLVSNSVVLNGGEVVTSQTITTPQTTAISGKVVLPGGQGASATLTFLDSNKLPSTYYVGSSSGVFSVRGFYPGTYNVAAWKYSSVTFGSRKGKLVQREPVSFTVTAGSPVTNLEIPLELGGKATGKIAYPDSKEPVKRLRAVATRVTPTGDAAFDVVEVNVDKKGKYAFDRLVNGVEYLLSFVDGDGVYRTTWYGGKKGKKTAKKSKVIVANAKTTTKLGVTTLRTK